MSRGSVTVVQNWLHPRLALLRNTVLSGIRTMRLRYRRPNPRDIPNPGKMLGRLRRKFIWNAVTSIPSIVWSLVY
jgi:hypothetical protein